MREPQSVEEVERRVASIARMYRRDPAALAAMLRYERSCGCEPWGWADLPEHWLALCEVAAETIEGLLKPAPPPAPTPAE